MQYFDYESLARAAHIPAHKLDALCRAIRQEFPNDDMLYELHLLRACIAIRDGRVTIDEAIREEKAA